VVGSVRLNENNGFDCRGGVGSLSHTATHTTTAAPNASSCIRARDSRLYSVALSMTVA
jgi:hypothetical protein